MARPLTDAPTRRGIFSFEISHQGRWYVRLIRMVPVPEEGVDYESNWATLTFDVRW